MPTCAAPSRALFAALLLAACERAPAPTPDPTPTPARAGTTAVTRAAPTPAEGAAGTTSGPSGPPTAWTSTAPPEGARLPAPVAAPPVELLEAQALVPGATTALKQGEQVTVDPGATFRVVLKGTFPEARLSLLDGADAMLPSAGAREAGPGTTVTLQPAAPLKAGSALRLRVDGATTRELKASDGTVRAPVEFPILVAGEPPPEPKSKTRKQRKRP